VENLYQGKIHGYLEIIKIVDGVPFILDKVKGEFKWVETVMEVSRLKKFRPISVEGLVNIIKPIN
jgi:hypothetical protein